MEVPTICRGVVREAPAAFCRRVVRVFSFFVLTSFKWWIFDVVVVVAVVASYTQSLVSCTALFKAFLNLTECKQRIWFLESGKFLFVESAILGFWIQNTAQESGIALNCTWNTESKFHWQRLESGVRGVESRIQDCLGFLYMERSTLLKRKDWPFPQGT